MRARRHERAILSSRARRMDPLLDFAPSVNENESDIQFHLRWVGAMGRGMASTSSSVQPLARIFAGVCGTFGLLLGLFLGVGGCASKAAPAVPPATPMAAKPLTCDERVDRKAILAMAGSFRVAFDFEETEVLAPGYEKRPPLGTEALELVAVAADSKGRVSLQHLLLIDGGVTKHWRQDWAFEDRELLEFKGRNTWAGRQVSADEARCSWTQAVFEVDDSPRYEGIGRWRHDAQGSVWQSNETWRPLPRREYTKRSDYDVLLGVNRHRITRTGWEHEQANVKLVLSPQHSLVRERGLNRYTRVDAETTALAASYWQATGVFWQLVRAEWTRVLAARTSLQLSTEVAGARLYEPLFERAEARVEPAATSVFIHETIARYLVGAAEPSASMPGRKP